MKKALYCASVWIHINNFHIPYIRELEHTGWEVHVAAGDIPEDAPFANTYSLPVKKKLLSPENLRVILRLARLIRKERFNLIHVHTTLAAFLCRAALLLSRTRGVRLIYVCHGYFFMTDGQGRIKKNLRSLFYLLCEKMLSGQTTTLVLMNREDYLSANRYRLCGDIRFSHGMGLVPERYIRTDKRKSKDDGVVFLCVGEFSARKNQEQIIRAFYSARKQLPNSELWFAGDGVKRSQCERLASDLGVLSNVRFLGHVPDISALYPAADVLVSASRSEGLPFCIMEALYFGLPIIASDVKGHRDLIEHGKNGILYDLSSDLDLSGCMVQLGLSQEKRDDLSEQAILPEEYFLYAAMAEFFGVIGEPIPEKAERTPVAV